MVSNEIDRTKCAGLTTDKARATVEKLTGVIKRVKVVDPLITAVHYSISQEALATKTVTADLKMFLDEAMRAVHFIKSCPLQS